MATVNKAERYSDAVVAKLRKELVLKDGVIFNNDYQGSPKAGAVNIRNPGSISVVDYDPDTGATLARADSSWIKMVISKDKAVNVLIDGYDAAAIPDGVVADALDEGGYKLALAIDADGAATLVAEGTAMADTDALTSSTAYTSLVSARTALTKAGVPNDGRRWAILSPDAVAYVLEDTTHFVRASDLGDEVVQSGAIGRIAGFNVYESANLPAGVEYIVGHPKYATRAQEFSVPVSLNELKDGAHIGASAVQGRYVYDHKVTVASAILVKTIKAKLSALTLGSLTLSPTFAAGTYSYTTSTTDATNTITATGATGTTVAIKNGTTSVNSGSAATWAAGKNTVTITVTADDKLTSVYTVEVTKS